MREQDAAEYVLGIDLGSNSLGWAIVGLVDDVPARLIRAGVRVFEAGVQVDPKTGAEQTLNAQRREARLHRRQLWRRGRRLKRVFNLLQQLDFLPPTENVATNFRKAPAWGKPRGEWTTSDVSDARQDYLNWLDQSVLTSPWFANRHPICAIPRNKRTPDQKLEFDRLNQLLPYILRAAAVQEPLEAQLLGRALYQFAQRRGFWSNRKQAPRKGEKPGKVEDGIRTLRSELGDRTLGQCFAALSPFERRIRDRWTARDMYQTEFKRIWEQQAAHRQDLLTDEARRVLYAAIFDQRPIRLKGGLVGQCEFEPNERRAPAYLLPAQRFRLLQVVNNLKIRVPGGEYESPTKQMRDDLIDALERCSEMSFKGVREKLGLSRRHSINLQRDKEEAKMPGNDTGAQFYGLFGERWFRLSAQEQDQIVADAHSILSVRDADQRRKRAENYLRKKNVADHDKATEKFLSIALEAGYRNLSIKAIKRFLRLLERGCSYGSLSPHYRYLGEVTADLIRLVDSGVPPDRACEQVLTRKPEATAPLDLLPPILSEDVQRRIGSIRNPIVARALTELRKVVNAILSTFGKPARVHIELLRELRKPKDAREKIWKENLTRERRNRTAEDAIKELAPNISRVTPKDIEKYRLWQESERCPYCRRTMTQRLLFGDDSEYQIDHIIPWTRCLDDSFVNKVLCHTQCNRDKGDRTPYEAFSPEHGGDADRYHAMLQCLAALKGDKEIREEKVRRFKMNDKALEEFLTTWNARQFIDSAYASRLAADYAGLLYGGREDADGNLRVQVRPGGLTKHFREAWRLNSILGDGETKNGGRTPKPRHDHRHHAIDAAVIAAANQEMFTRLSNAAKRRQLGRPGRFGDFDEPWPGFRSELKTEVLERVVASHRVSKKVSGALHEETIYSRFNADATKDSPLREPRLRQWINELSARDVENIADESVKLRVREKLAEVGGDPRKLPDPKDPANLQNLPYMIAKQDGRHIPIKRVRVKVRVQPVPIGAGHGQRYVKLGSNHHIEIYAETDKQGREQWKGEVVTMFEAYQRLKGRRGVVNPDAKANLVFSLAPGESVRFGEGSFKGQLFVMRGVTQEGGGRVFLVPINDARKKEEIVASKLYRREFISTLHEWKTRKVVVGPLGEVSEAHD